MVMVSRLIVMPSSTIWWTNSPTRSRARAFWLSSRASLPLAMISSSSDASPCVSTAAAAAAGWASGAPSGALVLSDICVSSLGGFLDLLLALGVRGDVLEQDVQVVVAVELGQQVVEALAGFEQLAQRLDLLDQALGAQVVQAAEAELDVQLAAVVL